MISPRARLILSALPAFALACEEPAEPDPTPSESPLEAVDATETWTLPCLDGSASIVFTEFGHPHVYGGSREDVACAHGFVTARDRWFQMELIRRNGVGRLAELLGEDGLDADIEIRTRRGKWIADQMLSEAPPEQVAIWTAYAGGVNAYIDAVRAERLPAPPALVVLAPLLGSQPIELMEDWDAYAVLSVASTINYVGGFETTDIRNQSVTDSLETWGLGLDHGALRHAGAIDDIWNWIRPPYPLDSAAGTFPYAGQRDAAGPGRLLKGSPVEVGTMDRALAWAEANQRRLSRRFGEGFGSNAWAIGPEMSEDGVALLGADGHLSLSVPPFLHAMHLDTELLGGDDLHIIGATIPGVPFLSQATNGHIAFGHTSQGGSDINDWYRESVVLDGATPTATLFQGAEVPIVAIDETYVVGEGLGGEARTVTIARWETGSGRPIVSMEGTASEEGAAGAVNVNGDWIVPGDVNDDGRVDAISAAASHWAERFKLLAFERVNRAGDVEEFKTGLSTLVSFAQNFIAADTEGNVLYTGYQGMPCREYLPRDGEGLPVDGANPTLLIDGTQYPSFTLEHDEAQHLLPNAGDPLKCLLGFDEYPHALNPPQGWVGTTNNAPFGAAYDNNLFNDGVYIGGPWYGTPRFSRLDALMEEHRGSHSVDTVAAMQADRRSFLGAEFLDELLAALSTAAAHAADGAVTGPDGAMAAAYLSQQEAIDEAVGRLEGWRDDGFDTPSGVKTFYDGEPTGQEVQDAIATMIFNAWFPRFQSAVFDDEGLPGVWRVTGRDGRLRALKRFVEGVGEGNPLGLSSWNEATGESIFFDVQGTEEVETRDQLMVQAFADTMEYLASPFGAGRTGGFNSTDQGRWIWGLKHMVRFENFLVSELGGDDQVEALFRDQAITPDNLPLDDPAPAAGDLRFGLPGFPRHGDNFTLDASNAGGPNSFVYGSGPVNRIAVALDPAGIHGQNILPGGQSDDPESRHFSDQAAAWLGNEATPLRFYVEDVVANATGRWVLEP